MLAVNLMWKSACPYNFGGPDDLDAVDEYGSFVRRKRPTTAKIEGARFHPGLLYSVLGARATPGARCATRCERL